MTPNSDAAERGFLARMRLHADSTGPEAWVPLVDADGTPFIAGYCGMGEWEIRTMASEDAATLGSLIRKGLVLVDKNKPVTALTAFTRPAESSWMTGYRCLPVG